jgi:hypothetical protein
MTMGYYSKGCEPLRVWNRLEPRSRTADFAASLRAEIHDPLWLLARQWQFGEFRGEDTGSPIFARVAMRTAAITHVRNNAGVTPRSDALPLEAWIERDRAPDDLARRARLGQRWLAVLDHHGRAFNTAGGTPLYLSGTYRTTARTAFPLVAPSVPEPATDADTAIARARQIANPRLRQLASAIGGRAVDGEALLSALPPGPLTWSVLPSNLKTGVPLTHQPFVLAAFDAFRAYCAELITTPASPDDTAWNASQLEYSVACRVPRPGGGSLELRTDEHDGGDLDWHSFDVGASQPGSGPDSPALTTTTFTIVPSPAEFPGQPHPRLWQFEDGSVDLGNIRADTTDLAKIIVAEFALVYGNNWFVIPCQIPIGTLAEIEGIVVTDVFGQRSLVRSATRDERTTWARWSMFDLSTDQASPLGSHLLVPPTITMSQQGTSVETVRFARDEMANTVWAIETRIADGMGGGRDGHDAARRVADALRADAPPATAPTTSAAPYRYTLGTSVPDNWIPFIPVRAPADDRSIRLQRASMPRFLRDTVRPVRPSAHVLRIGLDDRDRQTTPFFVNEEEVPRAGVELASGYQRTRWIDGRTVVWYGTRRNAGRGTGSSGLRFDVVSDAEQPE